MNSDLPYPRHALSTVLTALSDTPIVVVQGARQVGKSTLVQMIGNHQEVFTYTLDDPQTLDLALEDPRALVGAHPHSVLAIDEAQRAPGLILPIKANVDADRRPGRFILTGSADLLHVKGVGDSLAGRAETVEIMPLSQGELARRDSPEDFVTWIRSGASGQDFPSLDPELVIRGGYPEVCTRVPSRRRNWFDSYISRLSDHDARDLHSRGYADHLLVLLTHIGASGQAEFVRTSYARHLGVAESTIDGYIRTAQTMRLIQTYKPWNRAPHKRLVKRPKVSLTDTGLSAALNGFTTTKAMTPGGREYYGCLVEQFVALELAKQRTWTQTPYDIYHFRDLDGLEIDLVLETSDGDIIAIEVKSTTTPSQKHWNPLKKLRDRFPDRSVTGILFHTGVFSAHLHNWLHVLPITALWEHEFR